MADLDGLPWKSTKTQKTKILPLRWIGNICGEIATNSLVKAFDLQGQNEGYRFKFHCFIWNYLNRPYQKWGTFYTMEWGKPTNGES